jgi:hypothetical protein
MARLTTALWALSWALSRLAAAQDTAAYPATVEFDVVFPSNKTYAPAPVFPIVFAVQNLAAAAPATPISIQWDIVDINDGRRTLGSADLPNTSSSDPYYVYVGATWLMYAGHYRLRLSAYYQYCPSPDDDKANSRASDGLKASLLQDWSLHFTLEAGAQQPDLGADMDTCPVPMATVEMTDDPLREPHSICAIPDSDSGQPPANPCAAKLDKEAASSISAKLAKSTCSTGCPSIYGDEDESLGSRVPAWTGMLMGPLVAGFLLYATW